MRHRLVVPSLLLLLAGCAADPPTGPTSDNVSDRPANALDMAKRPPLSVIVRINLVKGTLAVAPAASDFTVLASGLRTVSGADGRPRVLFDVAPRNLSSSLEFLPPTSPPPPSGYTGLMLYPSRISILGGRGTAAASTDWDQPPHDFSGKTRCYRLVATDCHRWEPYPSPLRPGATARPRQVGFYVSPGLAAFDVELVLSADLGGGETGLVQAHVESADLGPLAGVTVTAGGQSAVTNAAGVAVVTGVATGLTSVAVSSLPPDCVNPGPMLTTVTANATAVVKFGVSCFRRIVFASSRDNSTGEIYSMPPDGSGITRLTFEPTFDGHPSQSPSGSRIVFVSSRDPGLGSGVYVMNADGSGVTRLAYGNEAAWSQDGSTIAYTVPSLRWAIYTMNADGSGQTQRTFPGPTDLDLNPSLAPDGRIAFTRITPHPDDYNDYNIWVLSASGTVTQITSGPALDFSPSWSPDGTRIAYASGPNGGSSGNGGPTDIWVMNADGTGQVKLTESLASDFDPTWSPNGASIAFTSQRDGQPELYVMNADGSGETRITNHPAQDREPSWKP